MSYHEEFDGLSRRLTRLLDQARKAERTTIAVAMDMPWQDSADRSHFKSKAEVAKQELATQENELAADFLRLLQERDKLQGYLREAREYIEATIHDTATEEWAHEVLDKVPTS